jgi:hypothetical protein
MERRAAAGEAHGIDGRAVTGELVELVEIHQLTQQLELVDARRRLL